MPVGLNEISTAARAYGLSELCRRAGLTGDDLQNNWRIERSENGHSLALVPAGGQPGRIVFQASSGILDPERVVRKSWLAGGSTNTHRLIPDLIVPFCRADSAPSEPLFAETGPSDFHCTEDLLTSTVAVLSRFEESTSPERDRFERCAARDSLAFRHGYLDRPIVDEWGLALQEVLRALMPRWQSPPRSVRIKMSHDADDLGIPFDPRPTAGHLIKRKAPVAFARDLLSTFTGTYPGYLRQLTMVCAEAGKRGINSAIYWKSTGRTAYDRGYDINDHRIARVMDWAREKKIEMGVHPGFYSFRNPGELHAEVDRCRAAIGESRLGGRQHYLRWCPQTWVHWEQCGLAYDSSVGYADQAGFRAGTCWPYFPWIWSENRRADLMEIPLIVMDATLVGGEYMRLGVQKSVAVVKSLLDKCAAVGGVLATLWHNSSMMSPYARYLSPVFDMFSGIENYDWEADFARQQRFHACSVRKAGDRRDVPSLHEPEYHTVSV